jgi:DNA gyrase subunit A
MAIRFDEKYDPERNGAGLRPMGRNAAGNRGISLKKNDYVIGAAITRSGEMRDQERDELAEKLKLTDKLATLRKNYAAAEEALQKTREDMRSGSVNKDATKAAEKAVDDAYKALKKLDEKLGVTQQLILTVTENGYGKRTDIDEYRLTARGAQGVTNLKATAKVGKTASIQLVNETSELMVISQWGKIIRINTSTVREAGRVTSGVRLLNLDAEDKVAAAVVIPPEEVNGNGKDEEQGTLLQ